MRSTFGTVSVPYASAAMACAPPMRNMCVMPSHCAMPIISGLGFGHATQMVATPATCAGITVISSVEGRG